MIRSGRCLCGGVRYTVEDPVTAPQICHCRECQRQSGHAWAAITAPVAQMRLTDEGSLGWYRASAKARRGFCRECGSFLFWQRVGADTIDISMGSLDDRADLHLEAEIWCAEQAPYAGEVGTAPCYARRAADEGG